MGHLEIRDNQVTTACLDLLAPEAIAVWVVTKDFLDHQGQLDSWDHLDHLETRDLADQEGLGEKPVLTGHQEQADQEDPQERKALKVCLENLARREKQETKVTMVLSAWEVYLDPKDYLVKTVL